MSVTPFGQFVLTAAAVLLFIVAGLWFFLPFAVFGLKARIDRQAKLSSEILAELQGLRGDLRVPEHMRADSLRDLPMRNDRAGIARLGPLLGA